MSLLAMETAVSQEPHGNVAISAWRPSDAFGLSPFSQRGLLPFVSLVHLSESASSLSEVA